MQKAEGTNGLDIYRLKAWDYAGMCEVLEQALQRVRDTHVPAVFHVEEVTQPQGHSTSGSHERYKSPERLEWEREWDCIRKYQEWIVSNQIATEEELTQIWNEAKEHVKESRKLAWEKYQAPIKQQLDHAAALIGSMMVNDMDAYTR
ncbi:MAG: thiamine pyrophosphate-dependent enzyme, partial [Methylophilaceae bacterium]